MKPFMDDDFLLESDPARELYHNHAAKMPIFDYHCHLPPNQIAENYQFANLTEIWLKGDHYKWRAMRTNGVAERLITGNADDEEKFRAWAETVPATIGNPLYHWTHLELRKPFGITDILNGDSAADIWTRTGDMLALPEFSTRAILRKMNVRVVCTTDDPVDDLHHHEAIAADASFETKVLPAFRPDKALAAEYPARFNEYLAKLEEVTDSTIDTLDALKDALRARIDYFHARGCRLSDHALVSPVADFAPETQLSAIFRQVRSGHDAKPEDVRKLKTDLLLFLAREYAERDWTFQLHLSALRNNSTRMFEAIGPDTGFDSIADEPVAAALSRFLDTLDVEDHLPRTILYTLNPRDNEILATTIGNFQDGSVPGKMQFGSGWWFNDQIDGMRRQMTALANMSLLSRFVGMLTDSRSFLSYPRHEYFRRVLCNMIGEWVEAGLAPNDMATLGGIVRDISWNNAVDYFGIDIEDDDPYTL